MACPDYEDRIMDLQEGTLPAGDRRAVEDHVAACMACRRFAERLQELDRAMGAASPAAGVSADFKVRLMQRMDLEAAQRPALALRARQDQAEREYLTMMADSLRMAWRSSLLCVLDAVGLAAVAGIAVLVLRPVLGTLPPLEAIGGLIVKSTAGYLAWVWAAAGIAAGLWIAFGQRWLGRIPTL